MALGSFLYGLNLIIYCFREKRKFTDSEICDEVDSGGGVLALDTDPEIDTLPSSGGKSSSTNSSECGVENQSVSQQLPSTPSCSKSGELKQAYDIGNYIAGREFEKDNNLKLKLLNEHWTPPRNFQYPYSTRLSHGKQEKRFLRNDHLLKFPWLVFSPEKKGLFCKACVLFSPQTAGRGSQLLKALVSQPLNNYARLLGKNGYLTEHETTDYHKTSVIRATEFEHAFRQGTNIIEQIDTGKKEQAEENRKRLRPIVKTIMLCGKQNIPMRGHRDDGPLLPTCDDTDDIVSTQEGNFRALLKFRIDAGDVTLEKHLSEGKSNATYISKTTQNELITAAGMEIRDAVLKRVSSAKYFTILADETTDISKTEQMSICIRYVYADHVYEDFLDFVPVIDMTGAGLAEVLLNYMKEVNLDTAYLVGQGYDGAAAMSGAYNGVQAKIKEYFPLAMYMHCASHSLNLVLSTSCKVQCMRNTQGIITEVVNFINSSAKRVDMLKNSITSTATTTKRQHLVKFCETRWVERHDSIECFCELYEAILDFLEKCKDLDATTSAKAFTLHQAITNPEFIVSVAILCSILSVTMQLSKTLQQINLDLIQATSEITAIRSSLQSKRSETEVHFEEIWSCASDMAEKAETDLTKPRISKRSTNRGNIPSSTAFEYYRLNHYSEFLDHVLMQLDARFTAHNNAAFTLSALVPSLCNRYTYKDVQQAVKKYEVFLNSEKQVMSQFHTWQQKWKVCDDAPCNAILALAAWNSDFFPDIYTLLQILCTLPVSTATPERTFSKLRLLKSYLRSTTSQARLNGLAHMYIHRKDVNLTPDAIIQRFAQKSRRLDFVL